MKKLFLTAACVLFTSLAFAQTSTNPASNTRYYTNKTGSVAAFQPGRSITISGNMLTHDARFVVSPSVTYTLKGGGPATPGQIRTGQRVELSFNSEGQVDRIALVDQR